MRGFVLGWGVRILIVVAIAVGALILRDRLSSNAGELKVGDCFDDPAASSEVSDVQHHPCTEPHSAEVIFLGSMTGDNAAYPADSVVQSWVTANCNRAWAAYTGKDPDVEEVLGLAFYQPTTAGWAKGDRQIICFAARIDGAPMTSSVKASP